VAFSIREYVPASALLARKTIRITASKNAGLERIRDPPLVTEIRLGTNEKVSGEEEKKCLT
jgi:hypothetical protein